MQSVDILYSHPFLACVVIKWDLGAIVASKVTKRKSI